MAAKTDPGDSRAKGKAGATVDLATWRICLGYFSKVGFSWISLSFVSQLCWSLARQINARLLAKAKFRIQASFILFLSRDEN